MSLLAQPHGELAPVSPDCELYIGGFWGQPVNTVTSLALVFAGVFILMRWASRQERGHFTYGVLAVATGVGSFIEHGPSPWWGGIAHDAPLIALLAFVAVDAASDLRRRELSWAWWVLPSLVVLVVSEVSEPARIAAQTAISAVAIGLSLWRSVKRPAARRTILIAALVLGAGALIGTLSRTGMPLCNPESWFQGHGVWHVLAAIAIWRLTRVIGTRPAQRPSVTPARRT
ncbi:hypothetical protein ONR57_13330 [Hoyosella sp. YIM 151337]|uniref:hypothetical protein n=1 Tax=Hoyosella sp. YIM 151337 TaxID=2992742 RepID=UPI002235B4C5|nr:hypothetical protein [Hoyosella sp. YIM 151337]MCW4354283.1 hypothetical protein [Hoyosella sp. YIM 151337]